MQLVQKMDAGPIYLQETVPLTGDETTASLQAKLTPIGARLLMETIEKIKQGTIAPRVQDEAQVTFAPMIKKEDGVIDWTQTAVEIERRIRGFTPWPSAHTYVRGKLLKVHRASVLVKQPAAGSPGEVVKADGQGFWVASGSGVLSLEEVQLENKKRLSGTEFLKGARIQSGERLY